LLVVDINFRAVPAVDEAGSLDALARGRTDHINYILAGREFSADWYLVTFPILVCFSPTVGLQRDEFC